MTPVVAIVGRPNVGKSTLMNRILGRREAIVEERPGVTRDRKEGEASWQGRDFTLVDTGGWIAGGDTLDDKVSRQSEKAIREADAVLFVVDATVGVTEDDARVAGLLRSASAPGLVVANKGDVDDGGVQRGALGRAARLGHRRVPFVGVRDCLRSRLGGVVTVCDPGSTARGLFRFSLFLQRHPCVDMRVRLVDQRSSRCQ